MVHFCYLKNLVLTRGTRIASRRVGTYRRKASHFVDNGEFFSLRRRCEDIKGMKNKGRSFPFLNHQPELSEKTQHL